MMTFTEVFAVHDVSSWEGLDADQVIYGVIKATT